MKIKRYTCPCCRHKTLSGEYDICSVCFWEDDPIQANNPDYEGGANIISLNQARINYKKIGACEEKVLDFVRTPLKREKR